MSNEKNTTPALRRILAEIFAFGALADIGCAAIFGYQAPLLGIFLLGSGVVIALVAFGLGAIYKSALARGLGYIALGLAVIITLAAIAFLFFDKNFEDRCVEAWKDLSQQTEKIERRIDRLEERFDND